ncbi:nitrite reductase small subunit NirD [Modestobacter marinus]|uniref:nitrite reductase small subunit NirD n=1 Tax=Modestobacter marinus TaxID=477641 RepID=UPI00201A66B0|nr:nitrite reductase small subunit NirD [Modestobacter marinus]
MTATLPPWTTAPTGWTTVCRYADLQPERGVAALVGDEQIALFRLFDGSLHSVGHRDPVSGAHVIARGIVGTRGDAPTVASPMYKQVFDLTTGVCLDAPDDPAVRLPVYPVRLRNGRVEVLAVDPEAVAP